MRRWLAASAPCWSTRPSCRACGQIALRYQMLGRALRTWGPPPDAPAGLADRILAAVAEQTLPRSRLADRHHAGSSGSGGSACRWPPQPPQSRLRSPSVCCSRLVIEPARRMQPGPVAATIPAPIRDLDGAPGGPDAQHGPGRRDRATWDLARSASEPAARISRQVFDAAISPEGTLAQPGLRGGAVPESVTGLSLDALAYDSAAAVATLQQVGDHLATGVKPLSSTARQAFGFLLGPARPKPEVRAHSPAARGA